jgi:hypothetical protein
MALVVAGKAKLDDEANRRARLLPNRNADWLSRSFALPCFSFVKRPKDLYSVASRFRLANILKLACDQSYSCQLA